MRDTDKDSKDAILQGQDDVKVKSSQGVAYATGAINNTDMQSNVHGDEKNKNMTETIEPGTESETKMDDVLTTAARSRFWTSKGTVRKTRKWSLKAKESVNSLVRDVSSLSMDFSESPPRSREGEYLRAQLVGAQGGGNVEGDKKLEIEETVGYISTDRSSTEPKSLDDDSDRLMGAINSDISELATPEHPFGANSKPWFPPHLQEQDQSRDAKSMIP